MKFKVFVFAFWLAGYAALAKVNGFAVTQSDNLIITKTPWGSSIYVAPVGFDAYSSYEFSIPLADLRSNTAKEGGAGRGGDAPDSAIDKNLGLDVSSLIAKANESYNTGNFGKSLQFVDEAIRREPQNVRAWIMRGSLMHVQGHDDLAKANWEKAAELDPGNAQIKNILKELK